MRGWSASQSIATLVAALAVAGCGPGSSKSGSTTASATTDKAVNHAPGIPCGPTGGALDGAYHTDIKAVGKVPGGRWKLYICGATAYVRNPYHERPIRTTLNTTPDRLVFGPDATCPAQTKPAAGIYSYKKDSAGFKLTKMSDSCPARIIVFNGHSFVREKR